MVLAYDPADTLGCAFVVVRSKLPDDLPCRLFDNKDDVGFAAVANEVFGIEAGVASVKPFVGAKA